MDVAFNSYNERSIESSQISHKRRNFTLSVTKMIK